MKLRVRDRLLVSLCGLCLFLTGAAIFLWSIGVLTPDQLAFIPDKGLNNADIIIAVCAALLVLLGGYNFAILFRRQNRRKGFVMQQTDNGEISISIKAMENLVQKCIDKHEELTVVSTSIDNVRDGVVVRLRIGLANGVSIPLAVTSLQKQIKQYISACSGIEVKEVRVQVDTANTSSEGSAFAVPEMFRPAAPEGELIPQVPEPVALPTEPIPQVEKSPVLDVPAIPGNLEQEVDAGEKRPLHQRLFGREEQPAVGPAPPIEPEAVPEEAPEAPMEEEAVSQDVAEDQEEAALDFVDEENAPDAQVVDMQEIDADFEEEKLDEEH